MNSSSARDSRNAFSRKVALTAIGAGALFRVLITARTIMTPALLAPAADDYFQMGRTWLQSGHYATPLFLPFYPLLCGALWWLAGSQPRAAAIIALMQLTLSLLTLILVYRLGTLLISEPVGLLAAALAAVEPALAHIHAIALTETFYTSFLLLSAYATCHLVLKPTRRPALSLWVAAAAALLATLTRATGIVVAVAFLFLLYVAYRKKPPTFVVQPMLAIATVALGLGLWMANIDHEFGHFALSCSGPHNIAALVVGPAKSRFEHVQPKAALDIWDKELGPERYDSNPFRKAQAAKSVAIIWAKQHPEAVLESNLRGFLHLEVGPGQDFYSGLLFGPKLFRRAVLAALGALCLLFFLLLMLGSWICFRSMPEANVLCLGTILFIVSFHTLSPGAFGQARFIAPVIPLESPMAAAGVICLLHKRRKQF